jgi:hypothetical protein
MCVELDELDQLDRFSQIEMSPAMLVEIELPIVNLAPEND